MVKTRASIDWGPFVVVLTGAGLLAVGAYQFLEARSFLANSAPATAVITAMKDVATDEGYHLCQATVQIPGDTSQSHAEISLGGYWPETGGSCAKVGENLAVRYRQTNHADIRPLDAIGSDAHEFIVMGMLWSLPPLGAFGFALMDWWSNGVRHKPRLGR